MPIPPSERPTPRTLVESTFTSIGSVRVREAALTQSCGELRDLAPGEWAFGRPASVIFDEESRLLLIDTFDAYERVGTKAMLESNPMILRVIATIGELSVMSYVADMSYMRSLHYRHIPLDIQESVHNPRLEQRMRSRGSEYLGGVILREFGAPHYYGEAAFAEQVNAFKAEFDVFAAQLRTATTACKIPGLAPGKHDTLWLPDESLPDPDREGRE